MAGLFLNRTVPEGMTRRSGVEPEQSGVSDSSLIDIARWEIMLGMDGVLVGGVCICNINKGFQVHEKFRRHSYKGNNGR
jgi:hypothetical protein